MIRVAFLIDGDLASGSLDDYARSYEQGHYSGIDVSRSVWIAEAGRLVERDVRIVPRGPGVENEFALGRIELDVRAHDDPEVADFRIDLRA